jgi:ELWxxDGT repeat protein
MKIRSTVIALLFYALQTNAQQIRLVKDIDSHLTTGGYDWQITVANDMMFFVVDDGVHGEELWKSDGTEDGTMLVKNITPLSLHSFPKSLTPVNELLFFTAWDGVETGRELWKSDGTELGTVMVKDFISGDQNAGPVGLTELNGVLYFLANNGTSGSELWRSDGSATGTYRVRETAVGWDGAHSLVKGGDKLFFINYSVDHGYELWVSDGTEEGTHEVKDIGEGTSSGVGYDDFVDRLVSHEDGVYFTADDGVHGKELWNSDGTADGTFMVKDFFPGQNIYGVSLADATAIGNKMFFRFGEAEVWSTEGTEATTTLVKIVMGPGFAGIPSAFAAYGNKVLFNAFTNPVGGHDVWISDGTEAGTFILKRINDSELSSVYGFKESDGKAYFMAENSITGSEPWVTDGTPEGTHQLFDLVSGAGGSNPTNYIAYHGQTFFTAENETFGRELFRADNTIVKNIHVTTGHGLPWPLFSFQHELFFNDWSGNFWKTDGTEAGTDTVRSHVLADLANSVEFNGKQYFVGGERSSRESIYETDGTYEGTKVMFELNTSYTSLVKHQGSLYFFRYRDLYKSNGTAAGTELITTVTEDPGVLISCGNYLYFSAGELWRSDGTEAGTHIVEDIVSGNVSSPPFMLTPASDGVLYFIVETAGIGVQLGLQLWRSDGTEAGTFMLKSFLRSSSWQGGHNLVTVGEILYFSALFEEQGHVPWKSDGTIAGTAVLKDTHDSLEEIPWRFCNVNGMLFFTVNTGHNDEIWKTDGTPAGTVLIKKWDDTHDITSLINHNGELFFISSSVTDGWGIGKSDGTTAGTIIYYPQEPGGGIHDLLPVDDKIFFVFQSDRYGEELYVLETGPGVLCRDFSIRQLEGTQQACVGAPITLTANMVTATPSLTYTWMRGSEVIAVESDATLLIESANLSDAGIYSVIVSNGSCSTQANTLKVVVKDAPHMIEQSIVDVCHAEQIKIILSSSEEIYTAGYNVLGVNVPGGVSASPGNATVSPEDTVSADFIMRDRYVNDSGGEAVVQYLIRPVSTMGCVGNNVSFNVQILPQPIVNQPQSQEVCEGTTVTLDVETIGSGAFQWKKNNNVIPGATVGNLIVHNTTEEDAGVYSVVYNNGQCVTESDGALVDILLKPAILDQPQSTTIEEGSLLELFVNAAGSNNEYAWKKNNVTIPAAIASTFSKFDITVADNGNYQVVITNSCGAATSAVAMVEVIPTPVLTMNANLVDFVATAGAESFPQHYLMNGANLQGPVDMEADEGFEISLSQSSGYATQLSVEAPGGTLASKKIFVRFVPTLEANYEGFIRHYSLPAILVELPVRGFGLTTPNEKEQEDKLVTAYPNPVKNALQIEFKQALPGKTDIVIYTLEGQRVYTRNLESARAGEVSTIHTLNWKSGSYFLVVVNAQKQILNRKIIKIETP